MLSHEKAIPKQYTYIFFPTRIYRWHTFVSNMWIDRSKAVAHVSLPTYTININLGLGSQKHHMLWYTYYTYTTCSNLQLQSTRKTSKNHLYMDTYILLFDFFLLQYWCDLKSLIILIKLITQNNFIITYILVALCL